MKYSSLIYYATFKNEIIFMSTVFHVISRDINDFQRVQYWSFFFCEYLSKDKSTEDSRVFRFIFKKYSAINASPSGGPDL